MCDSIPKKRKIQRRFTGTYKYPEWFSKEKYIFCESMLERLNKLMWIHSQSADYYEKRHFRIFFPNITITAISGIASFLSTSQFVTDDTQTAFGITVGVLASISALVQSIASVTRYSAKAESHQLAADEYNKLLTRLKFEMEMPNEKDFLDNLEASILDIQNKCNYFPPQFIVNNYYKTRAKNIRMKNKVNKLYYNIKSTDSDSLLQCVTPFSNESLYTENDHILINIEEENNPVDVSSEVHNEIKKDSETIPTSSDV